MHKFRPDLIYAGIGSRKTPIETCSMMTHIADYLADLGWFLRSGGADRADQAFERGARTFASQPYQIHLPWDGYNNTREDAQHIVPDPTPEIAQIAADHHPNWDNLSSTVRLFMCRNVTIILGEHLDQPAKMVVGWTPGGQWTGGTSHGFRVAAAYKIPIFNLALEADRQKMAEFVDVASQLPVAA